MTQETTIDWFLARTISKTSFPPSKRLSRSKGWTWSSPARVPVASTQLIAPHVASITAVDVSQAMLEEAKKQLLKTGCANWKCALAPHEKLPAEDQSCDLVLSGWATCYATREEGVYSEAKLNQVLAEFTRVLRPGGMTILLETFGTGFEKPNPPEKLIPYFAALENNGFEQTCIRTDYKFGDLDDAVRQIGFFFGEDLANQVQTSGSIIVPECTGIFLKKW